MRKIERITLSRIMLIFIVLLVAGSSCRTSSTLQMTGQEKSKIEQEIKTLVNNFFSPGLNYQIHTSLRANVDGYTFAGDGVIQFTSYEAYREQMEKSFSRMYPFHEVRCLDTRVYVLAPDAAACTTVFESKYRRLTGDTVVNNGCWTMVFKKFGNDWKIVMENGTHLKDKSKT